MLRRTCTTLMVVLLLTTLAWGAAAAQEKAVSPLAMSAVQLPGGLELSDSLLVASPGLMQPGDFTGLARPNRRTGEVLMIVGGAGILLGVLTDESVITIAGAGVAGYGLYLFLR